MPTLPRERVHVAERSAGPSRVRRHGRRSKAGDASADRRPHVDGWIRCPRRAGAMTYRRFEGPGRNVYRVPEYPRECVLQ